MSPEDFKHEPARARWVAQPQGLAFDLAVEDEIGRPSSAGVELLQRALQDHAGLVVRAAAYLRVFCTSPSLGLNEEPEVIELSVEARRGNPVLSVKLSFEQDTYGLWEVTFANMAPSPGWSEASFSRVSW